MHKRDACPSEVVLDKLELTFDFLRFRVKHGMTNDFKTFDFTAYNRVRDSSGILLAVAEVLEATRLKDKAKSPTEGNAQINKIKSVI